MNEIEERLLQISEDFEEQYRDGSCPIMILTSIDELDLDYLREHIKDICRANIYGRKWAQLLLTYCVIDHVYENYGMEEDKHANIWPLIENYLSKYYSIPRIQLSKIILNTIEWNGFHICEESKKVNQNTILFNASSKHYSPRFFDFIMSQYNNLDQDLQYDLVKVSNRISDEFQEGDYRTSLMGHAFGLLPKEKEAFEGIFDRVINKIDQRKKGSLEYDLGRWEEAFNEWFEATNSAKYTRSKAELSLDVVDGEPYLKILFPSSKSVPREGYHIHLRIGNYEESIDVPVRKRAKIPSSEEHIFVRPLHTISPFGAIKAVDSTGIELLNIPEANYRFFSNTGVYSKNPSAAPYKVILKRGITHNLPKLFEDNVSEEIDLIHTTLESNEAYIIDNKEVVLERSINKRSISVDFANVGDCFVDLEGFQTLSPCHPKIILGNDIERLHIRIKDYSGHSILNEIMPVKAGILDLNTLVKPVTGVFSIRLTNDGYRLAAKKYAIVKDLHYHLDKKLGVSTSGIITYTSEEKSGEIQFTEEDMFVKTPNWIIDGKEFSWGLRTPNLFFNPHPGVDEQDWHVAGSEFDTNELTSTLSVSTGCIPDGEAIHLIIRSQLGTTTLDGITNEGLCSFIIGSYISEIQKKRLGFSVELRYHNEIIPIFGVKTLGSYDIDLQEDILAITPYKMPKNCKVRYDYYSGEESETGWLIVGQSAILDVRNPSMIEVVETNLDTNDQIVIYERHDLGATVNYLDLENCGLSELEIADHLLVGNACQPNVTEAIRIYESLSEQGDSNATLRLARTYMNGLALNEDPQKASMYFRLYLNQVKNKVSIKGNSD